MQTVLCYGDSNTHGSLAHPIGTPAVRLPYGQRWPDVMAAALGEGVQVIAEGLGGRTTVHDDPVEGGKRSGIEVLPAVLMSHVPLDLMVILLGTNDLKNRFSVTAFEIARSVERLVVEARRLVPGLDVLILSPVPVREVGTLAPMFVGAEARQQGLAEELATVAEMNGCAFLDLAPIGAVDPADGVHWTAATHGAVGRALSGAVTARLRAS